MKLPTNCPTCNTKVEWDENEVHLVCTNVNCPATKLQRIVSFFYLMEVEELGEGIIQKLYDAGNDTIEKICKMDPSDLVEVEGFASKKALKVHTKIQEKLNGVPMERLMHSSGFFRGLGSKKLALFMPINMDATTKDCFVYYSNAVSEGKMPSISIKGVEAFCKGFQDFKDWVATMPVKIAEKKVVKPTGSKCAGMKVCFTGFRDEEMEQKITTNGGEIVSSVSKNTTHLVMKQKGSGSSKEQKAESLGVKIMDRSDMEKFLNV